jgi:hypothetical protein
MTSINIPKDDIAVREAQAKDISTGAIPKTKATAPIQPTDAVDAKQQTPPPRTRLRQRKGDRRRGERRKKQVKVLLDTRSHQERRKHTRRKDDARADDGKNKGIDTYT